jgi:hypothetical protein
MNGDKFANVLGGLITVALVTTIVAHPASAKIVTKGGQAMANLLLAAQGRKP